MKFLTFEELKTRKGIPGHRVTIYRKEGAGKFPKHTPFGNRNLWLEMLIDTYNEALAGGHTEEEATAIAEARRPCAQAPEAA